MLRSISYHLPQSHGRCERQLWNVCVAGPLMGWWTTFWLLYQHNMCTVPALTFAHGCNWISRSAAPRAHQHNIQQWVGERVKDASPVPHRWRQTGGRVTESPSDTRRTEARARCPVSVAGLISSHRSYKHSVYVCREEIASSAIKFDDFFEFIAGKKKNMIKTLEARTGNFCAWDRKKWNKKLSMGRWE